MKKYILITMGLLFLFGIRTGTAYAQACTLTPPTTGTWVIDEDCVCGDTLIKSLTLMDDVDVRVENNAVLTIKDGFDFSMNLNDQKLVVKEGSGVLVKQGGTLKQK